MICEGCQVQTKRGYPPYCYTCSSRLKALSNKLWHTVRHHWRHYPSRPAYRVALAQARDLLQRPWKTPDRPFENIENEPLRRPR